MTAMPHTDAIPATQIQVVASQAVIETGIRTLIEGPHEGLRITTRWHEAAQPDVVFYDVIGLHEGDGADLDHWVKETSSIVIAVTRELRPDLGAVALERGAAAAISLGASREDFLEVIQAAISGELLHSPAAQDAEEGTRLGQQVSLTVREAEVIGLIVRGLSNREIAAKCCLTINSVKSYIRSAYRKMDVPTRSQAVKWGVQHGFALDDDSRPITLRRMTQNSEVGPSVAGGPRSAPVRPAPP